MTLIGEILKLFVLSFYFSKKSFPPEIIVQFNEVNFDGSVWCKCVGWMEWIELQDHAGRVEKNIK